MKLMPTTRTLNSLCAIADTGFIQDINNLVDAKSETNERQGCADPCQQGPLS
jgi:hypothetical protein